MVAFEFGGVIVRPGKVAEAIKERSDLCFSYWLLLDAQRRREDGDAGVSVEGQTR
jgi:hypothetical protein